VSWLTETE
jgi:hypothetical protein